MRKCSADETGCSGSALFRGLEPGFEQGLGLGGRKDAEDTVVEDHAPRAGGAETLLQARLPCLAAGLREILSPIQTAGNVVVAGPPPPEQAEAGVPGDAL